MTIGIKFYFTKTVHTKKETILALLLRVKKGKKSFAMFGTPRSTVMNFPRRERTGFAQHFHLWCVWIASVAYLGLLASTMRHQVPTYVVLRDQSLPTAR